MVSSLFHPALAHCRRLFLRNYEVMINIGVHDFEKNGEQRVLFNVNLFIPLAQVVFQLGLYDTSFALIASIDSNPRAAHQNSYRRRSRP